MFCTEPGITNIPVVAAPPFMYDKSYSNPEVFPLQGLVEGINDVNWTVVPFATGGSECERSPLFSRPRISDPLPVSKAIRSKYQPYCDGVEGVARATVEGENEAVDGFGIYCGHKSVWLPIDDSAVVV